VIPTNGNCSKTEDKNDGKFSTKPKKCRKLIIVLFLSLRGCARMCIVYNGCNNSFGRKNWQKYTSLCTNQTKTAWGTMTSLCIMRSFKIFKRSLFPFSERERERD